MSVTSSVSSVHSASVIPEPVAASSSLKVQKSTVSDDVLAEVRTRTRT